jgi:endogenous inhibitor of DNA gyrase (YacG/DUF329 family)
LPKRTADLWKVRVTERNVARGLQAPCDLEDIKERSHVRWSGFTPTLPGLLKHVAVHYSDYQLRNDLDCVLWLCGTEADRREVRKLARAKLAGKPYAAPEMTVHLSGAECASCGKRFAARRVDARFCSPRCRQRDRRRNAPGVSQIAG